MSIKNQNLHLKVFFVDAVPHCVFVMFHRLNTIKVLQPCFSYFGFQNCFCWIGTYVYQFGFNMGCKVNLLFEMFLQNMFEESVSYKNYYFLGYYLSKD